MHALESQDALAALQAQVRQAYQRKTPLRIVSGGSKRFLVGEAQGEPLDLRAHRGIVNYQPSELLLSARAGTPLAQIEAVLAEHGQMLACEPPHFSAQASFGGMVASGLSGPRRPWAGAVRDFVLGCRLIDGQGRALRFGGEVMKNVAGYDVSRLMAGSWGALAVITEVSMKVLPRPPAQRSLRLELSLDRALSLLGACASKPLPLSAACHQQGQLLLRLEGGERSVQQAARELGGESLAAEFWTQLREQALPFFQGEQALWRLSLPRLAPAPTLPAALQTDLQNDLLWDWAGAQLWLRSAAPPAQIHAQATALGGHARLWRGHSEQPQPPLSAALLKLHQGIKQAFDPAGIFQGAACTAAW